MLETLEILRRISVISSLENDFSEVDIMKRLSVLLVIVFV